MLCRLLAAAEDLHVIVGAAADDELGLAPVATKDTVRVSREVIERSPERPNVPHLDQRVMGAGNEEVGRLRAPTPVNASHPTLKFLIINIDDNLQLLSSKVR